ncbi:hypothetical protein HR45_14715 [Shewanella mangrovi]|uniref:ChrR-like cupin domain-containing protein n=2 Tax=Shewanella mangrovi TaxID=1515746 RepID=A0A094LNK1_9GAMM|nr:hypothetical protein HR45_14715 [Shewanella mangrovi]
MISHHPRPQLLEQHAAGTLPAGLAVAVATHCQMCAECRALLQQAEAACASQHLSEFSTTGHNASEADAPNFEDICAQITSLPATASEPMRPHFICVKGQSYPLPIALQQLDCAAWTSVGNISRMRYDLEDTAGRASLLHIAAGGSVPQHTHKGRELTLLLDGSFTDESGKYVKGDFIERDGSNEHSPYSEHGCLCFTLVDAPLHFTKGLGKLLNPFGQLLY